MAVIPSIAFTGVVMRTQVSIMLFGHYSANTVGIVAAALGLWVLNLVIPALAGSVLMAKLKLVGDKDKLNAHA